MSTEQWDPRPPNQQPPVPPVGPQPPDPAEIRSVLVDSGVVLGWFVAAGLLGAVLWWKVTPLASFTRVGQSGSMDEEQLARQFGANGWFFVIAAAGGLLSGLVLMLLRRRNPILMVVLVATGGALATWLMVTVGLSLGPADPSNVLPTVAEGGKVPLQLKTDAHGVLFVWSIAALLGAIFALWVTEARHPGGNDRSSG